MTTVELIEAPLVEVAAGLDLLDSTGAFVADISDDLTGPGSVIARNPSPLRLITQIALDVLGPPHFQSSLDARASIRPAATLGWVVQVPGEGGLDRVDHRLILRSLPG